MMTELRFRVAAWVLGHVVLSEVRPLWLGRWVSGWAWRWWDEA